MSKIQASVRAPDLILTNTRGQSVSLSNYHGHKNVVLMSNRGFFCPFCRGRKAQLRHNYPQLVDRKTEVVVAGPDDEQALR
jgi:peroxiredoxin